MKTRLLLLVFALISSTGNSQAVDQIIANYFEKTGGIEKWRELVSLKMIAKVNQGGIEIPIELTKLKDGRQSTTVNFQGKLLKQGVFDGSILWSQNFMSMKAEKADAETTENLKQQAGEFPDVFLNYKLLGMSAVLILNDSIAENETYKIKLTKKAIKVNGKVTDNIEYWYFDKKTFMPVLVETELKSGPGIGQTSQVKLSDYRDIGNGIYMPFTMWQGLKNGPGQYVYVSSIIFNPTIDENEFDLPEDK